MRGDVIIVGAFHEIIELCEDSGWNVLGIIDNNLKGEYFGIPILGKDEDAKVIYVTHVSCKIVISPDNPSVRKRLSQYYKDVGFDFATIVSPKAIVSKSAKLGIGTVIQSGVNVSSACIIGNFVKLNINSNIMHDNCMGDYCTVAPNAVLLGYVKLGDEVYIGANSTILPNIVIGERATIGAGAVVTRNIAANIIVKGVPAK